MNNNYDRAVYLAHSILLDVIGQSNCPLQIIRQINTFEIKELSIYTVLYESILKILNERCRLLEKIGNQLQAFNILGSDLLTSKKKQKIRFFVNKLEHGERKYVGKIVYSRKFPKIYKYKIVRKPTNDNYVIMNYIPRIEKIRIFSANGFYATISRDIIHYFLKNDAENLLKLWKENRLLDNE